VVVTTNGESLEIHAAFESRIDGVAQLQ